MLTAFQSASAVAPARSPKPILQNVKLEVTGSGETNIGQPGARAVFMATDLEVGIRVDVPGVRVESEGSVILPIVLCQSILRETLDPVLHIETDGQGTLVRGERSEFRLPAENPDEFPAVAEFKEQKFHELPARLLREMIRRTVFATDTESSRYALGGVLIELSADKIVTVGTDGRRLAMMEGPAKGVQGHETGDNTTIVPTKAMHLIERTLSDADAEVQVTSRSNDVLVRSRRATIYSRLVEGRFPRWRDVFPRRDEVAKIELPVGPFYSAVRQAAIVTDDESRGVDFSFGEGKAILSGRAAKTGQARVELPIDYQGSGMNITLDPKFLGEFLKVLDQEKTFTLELKDAESAAVCLTDDGYSYVIMPLSRDRG